jgi:adenosylcobinamide kinase/adenosylcobinamide-phosphate guanylyltransferase
VKLYIGGAYQGQDEIARRENPASEIFYDFHETVLELLKNGEDPQEYAWRLVWEKPDCVVVANEVGSGVVPIDVEDRAFRESVGRALCILAQQSDTVVRAVCGIGVRIK